MAVLAVKDTPCSVTAGTLIPEAATVPSHAAYVPLPTKIAPPAPLLLSRGTSTIPALCKAIGDRQVVDRHIAPAMKNARSALFIFSVYPPPLITILASRIICAVPVMFPVRLIVVSAVALACQLVNAAFTAAVRSAAVPTLYG